MHLFYPITCSEHEPLAYVLNQPLDIYALFACMNPKEVTENVQALAIKFN